MDPDCRAGPPVKRGQPYGSAEILPYCHCAPGQTGPGPWDGSAEAQGVVGKIWLTGCAHFLHFIRSVELEFSGF